MKKISKVLLIIMSFVILFCTFNNKYVYAEDTPSWEVTDEFNAGEWDPKDSKGDIIDITNADKKVSDIGNRIIGAIQVVGSLVSVIALIIIGIRYMLGSVEEKAQYKETLGPYILGAGLVFGISNILGIVYNIATSLN